jgi:hypothetical protein
MRLEAGIINQNMLKVENLDYISLFIAFTSFAYPIRLIQRSIYCRLTERKRTLKWEEWIELIFASATATWLGNILYYYLVSKKKGSGKIPGLEQSYVAHAIEQLESNDSAFKINFLIAVVAASFWFKVLMML